MRRFIFALRCCFFGFKQAWQMYGDPRLLCTAGDCCDDQPCVHCGKRAID